MNSSLCRGWVSHRRFEPHVHGFRYRAGMLYLDLGEQREWLGLSRLFGSARLAPMSWHEGDYLPALTRHGTLLAEAARLLVGRATGQVPMGPVHLLTQPRSWGLSFNPVSFYFCHALDGQLQAILLEVRNTPWRERYHYVLPVTAGQTGQFTLAKAFHVSPFMPLDMAYRLRFAVNPGHVRIHMENWRGARKVFEADLALKRQPLDAPALRRHVLAFPWMSLATLGAIYWQALRLLLKRTPLHQHTASQGDLGLGQPVREEPQHVTSDPER